ncbi:T cell receptor beta, variable 1 [Chelydra serpentina]|nr:T cell receptor beta, variable 1 [Chelydra serpentina]
MLMGHGTAAAPFSANGAFSHCLLKCKGQISGAVTQLFHGEARSVTVSDLRLEEHDLRRMSWYRQDAQGHLHFLVQSGTKGDKEKIIQEGTTYQSERASSTELRLEMQNVTQSQTIYCTSSKGTVRD